MKKLFTILFLSIFTFSLFAQSDDDLFGGDDDFFTDDSIVEVSDVSAKNDLSKGVIFDSGSIKVGGSLSAALSTNTVLYSPDQDDFSENFKNTKLTPDLSALLSVDARPTETLRIYTKFGFAYPFENTISGYVNTSADGKVPLNYISFDDEGNIIQGSKTTNTFADWFKLKELFTDFSIKDTAFFRFGVHTVTWGAGYFFSPVSDMINTSSIDPENPEKQVDGALNLRTQIVFPNSQNCLWFYVIPSTDFTNQTSESYARDTALAGKADILIGGWELGVGAFYKYQNAPKAMLTATGSLKKISFFGELVYSYGADCEWKSNTDWDDKTSIFQATAGFSYYWKEPKVTLAAQYYFESNDRDLDKEITQYGHNIALMASKGKLFNNSDLSLTFFAMANFGHKNATVEDLKRNYPKTESIPSAILEPAVNQFADIMPALTANLMLKYSPVNDLSFGAGPSITFVNFEKNPTVALKLTATLGGGKF